MGIQVLVKAIALAMLFQALAIAHLGSATLKSSDLMHSVLHWTGQAHEHHDDGTWEIDDSAAASQHVQGDQLTNPVALPDSTALTVLASFSDAPAAYAHSGLPHPHLAGPLRPPRSI